MRGFFGNDSVRIGECVLLLIGFVCVGWYTYSQLDTRLYQSYESYRLDASLRAEKPSIEGYLRHLISGARREREEPSKPEVEKPAQPDSGSQAQIKRPPMSPGSMVGRIEIPRIKVSTIVREGTDDKTLKRAAGHVAYTALPGESGNVGIAAHRDTLFRNLRHVKEGDVIRVETTWGEYEYIVDSLKIVFPTNVEVLDPTPAPSLTLVTCYPFNYVGSAPKRFIVHARQVNPAPESLKVVRVKAQKKRGS